jgi:hypothetical protein
MRNIPEVCHLHTRHRETEISRISATGLDVTRDTLNSLNNLRNRCDSVRYLHKDNKHATPSASKYNYQDEVRNLETEGRFTSRLSALSDGCADFEFCFQ